ncbi:MAG: hypothetical protein IKQ25_06295 [Lachnospiraceae bacterium]|nr:hypothetical protein [Lachnospiraceae bacterium]
MTSQSSTNNNSISLLGLMREDLHHKNWMLALSILGSFLAGPVACLFVFTQQYAHRTSNYKIIGDQVYNFNNDFLMTLPELHLMRLDICKQYLLSYHMVLMAIIACVGAAIVALFGFRYLYHKQMVDLYHSAPVSRGKLFLAFWLNGLLIWFVPALVSTLIVFVVISIYMKGVFLGSIFAYTLLSMVRLTLCFLIIYHVCLLGVMLSGNLFNAIIASFTLGLLAFVMTGAYMLLQSVFFDTVYLPDYLQLYHPLYAFSPMTSPIILIATCWSKAETVPTEVWHSCISILLMLVNFVLAYVLYQKRPSELSERGLEYKPVRIVFRYCISVLGGIMLGLIFLETTRSYTRIAWGSFGVLFGTALTFCVLNVIYHVSFKEVISHKLQYVMVLGTTLAIVFGMYFDVTGYDARLPKKENITGISLYVNQLNDPDCHMVMTKNGLTVKSGYDDPSECIISHDSEKIYELLSKCVADQKNNRPGRYRHFNVKVYTKWGSYYRTYKLSDENLSALAPFVATKEFAETFYPVKSLAFGMPENITISGAYTTDSHIADQERIRQLMEALHQDFEEHRSISDLLSSSRLFNINLQFRTKDAGIRRFNYDIPYWYEHTIKLVSGWYPSKQWDPKPDEILYLMIGGSLNVSENETTHAALYRYFGYDENGVALAAPAMGTEMQYTSSGDRYIHWNLVIHDVEFLKELTPYLIWGYYDSGLTLDYVPLGMAEFTTDNRIDCFIQSGKLPLELLEAIEQSVSIGYLEGNYDDIAIPEEVYDSFYQKY